MVATHSVNVATTHSTGHAYLGALWRRGWKGPGRINDFVCGALYMPASHFVFLDVTHSTGHAYIDVFFLGGGGGGANEKSCFVALYVFTCFGRGRNRGFVLYIFLFWRVLGWWVCVCLYMRVHTHKLLGHLM